MPKLSIYVETSVWSCAFAEDVPESREATRRFLDDARQGKYDLFISPIVLMELARASEDLAARLRGLVEELAPTILDFDEDMDRLAQDFLEHGVVPPSKVEDAQHVAVAVASELDVLVSWNYRHLVNVRRREEFHQVGVMNGYYKPLQIVTPPEVANESQ
jgi:predicted nucleic acid-binding protein